MDAVLVWRVFLFFFFLHFYLSLRLVPRGAKLPFPMYLYFCFFCACDVTGLAKYNYFRTHDFLSARHKKGRFA